MPTPTTDTHPSHKVADAAPAVPGAGPDAAALALLQALLDEAPDTDGVSALLRLVVQRLVEASGWRSGRAFRLAGEDRLAVAASWSRAPVQPLPAAAEVAVGEGAVGLAWGLRRPCWESREGGDRTVAIPLLAGRAVAAVIELTAGAAAPGAAVAAACDSDPALAALAARIAPALGRLVASKHDETSLREIACHQRRVLDSTVDAVIGIDEAGAIRSWNPAAERMFGFSAGEVAGQSLDLLIPPRLRAAHRRAFALAATTGELRLADQFVELVAVRRSGQEFPLELSLSSFHDGDRRFFTAIARDVSERAAQERALRDGEARNRALIETINEGLLVLDETGAATFANQRIAELLGREPEQFLGRSFLDFVELSWIHTARVQLQAHAAGEASHCELALCRPDGTRVWVIAAGAPLRDPGGRLAGSLLALTDVSERRNLEEELRSQSLLYEAVIQAQSRAGQGLAIFDPRHRLTFVNQAFAALVGYSQQELLAMPSFLQLIRAEDLAAVRERIARRDEADRDAYETVLRRRDGSTVAVELATAVIDATASIALLRDVQDRVTARAQADRSAHELSAVAARLHASMSTIDTAVALIDEHQKVVLINPAFESMFGIGRDDLLGADRIELIRHLAERFRDPRRFLAEVRPAAAEPFELSTVIEIQRPRRRVLRWVRKPVAVAGGAGEITAFTDITAEVDLAREREVAAQTDSLTGLGNRRCGEEALARESARARREHAPLSVVILDIDHFKRVNDHHGHGIGDEVMKAMAALLLDTVRESDLLVRWGGDELLVVLPQATAVDATQVAHRCRAAVEAWAEVGLPRVTVSAGVAQLRPAELPLGLVGRADERLYAAKRGGRNRVVAGE
jgi:diguanylate cyclase (GGDEF)-like protein/PAS domain S-box-containing protein